MVEIDLVLASDRRFFWGLQVSILSIALHEHDHFLRFHILDGGISEKQWESLSTKLSAIHPNSLLIRYIFDLKNVSDFCEVGELSLMAYARIFIPALIPVRFAIYVDSDFLVTKPISQLLAYKDENKAICAATDFGGDLSHDCPWGKDIDLSCYHYINTGLMLMNLDRWRKNGYMEELLSFLKTESIRCRLADQSAINWVLRDEISVVPQQWNVMANFFDSGDLDYMPGELNLHFASGMKPWKRPLPTPSHQLWRLFNRKIAKEIGCYKAFIDPRNLYRYCCLKLASKYTIHPRLDTWVSYWVAESKRRSTACSELLGLGNC